MYEYAKHEFNNWLKGLDYSALNVFDKTMLGILVDHFEEIAKVGTAKGGRARLICDYIAGLNRQTREDIPDVPIGTDSNPTITQLLSLEVERFRGFYTPIVFNFNKRYTLYHGTNGSGKTSMCEALEYSILGSIEEASARSIPINKYVIHTGEKDYVKPKLKCRFSDGSEGYCLPDLSAYRFAFIEKNRIDSFSHVGATTAKNQTERIAALFGLTEFQNYVKGFTESLDDRYIALSSKEADIEIGKKTELIEEKKENLKKNKNQLKKLNDDLNLLIADVNQDGVETAEQALYYLMNQETGLYPTMLREAKENSVPEINNEDVLSLEQSVERFLSEIGNLNKDINKLLGDVISLDLHDFYKSLNNLKASWDLDVCPACYTPLSKTVSNPFVLAQQKCEELEEIEKTKRRIEIQAEKAASLCLGIKRILEKPEIQELFHDIDVTEFLKYNYSADIFKVAADETDICTKTIKDVQSALEEKENIDQQVSNYNSAAKEQNERYKAELGRLNALQENIARKSEAKSRVINEIAVDEKDIKAKTEALNCLLEQQKEDRMNVTFNLEMVSSYNKLLGWLQEYTNMLPAAMSSNLSQKVAAYYNVINDGDADFELIEELSLPTDSTEKLLVKMKDGVTQDAMQLMSEGHVKILGLSILLAKAAQSGVPFLIFDDVVNAIDDDHRDGVAQLLTEHPDFESMQMILTCHGELFVSKIEDRIEGKKNVDRYRFLPADSLNERGVVIKYDDAKLPLECAKAKFESDERKDCAAKCRQAVESILPKLWREVAKHSSSGITVCLRNPQSNPDLRQIAEAICSATKPNKKLMGTESVHDCLKKLTADSTWTLLNKGTHTDSTIPEFTRGEIKELLHLVENLAEEVDKMKLVATNTPIGR